MAVPLNLNESFTTKINKVWHKNTPLKLIVIIVLDFKIRAPLSWKFLKVGVCNMT